MFIKMEKPSVEKTDSINISDYKDISIYQLYDVIGEGAYGKVFKARLKTTPIQQPSDSDKLLAAKKICLKNSEAGLPTNLLREIEILTKLDDVNVVKLIDICKGEKKDSTSNILETSIYLIMEFCEHDLASLLSANKLSNLQGKKAILLQIFKGLSYIHQKGILHRDVKPSNILVNNKGEIKIADFGLSRMMPEQDNEESTQLTNGKGTRWYLPPEILLGSTHYGSGVDVWAAGCTMAEILMGNALFPGTNWREQLYRIINVCGSISPDEWPEVEQLPMFNQFKFQKGLERKVVERLMEKGDKIVSACELVDQILQLNPQNRIDLRNAMEHAFFQSDPKPLDQSALIKMMADVQSMPQCLNKPIGGLITPGERASSNDGDQKKKLSLVLMSRIKLTEPVGKKAKLSDIPQSAGQAASKPLSPNLQPSSNAHNDV